MPEVEPSEAPAREALGRAGFATGSDIYERARPGYPPEAVAHLERTTGITTGTRVLDLAAGTGKLTRQLRADGATCLAVEPSASMREVFGRMVRGTALVGGTAEMVPVADATMDVVVVAQAFHWFDPPAGPARDRPGPAPRGVARPHLERAGRVGSGRRRTGPYQQVGCLPALSDGDGFRAGHRRSGLFGPVERTKFRFVQLLDQTAFVEQVASRSYVAGAPRGTSATRCSTRWPPSGRPWVSRSAMPYISRPVLCPGFGMSRAACPGPDETTHRATRGTHIYREGPDDQADLSAEAEGGHDPRRVPGLLEGSPRPADRQHPMREPRHPL